MRKSPPARRSVRATEAVAWATTALPPADGAAGRLRRGARTPSLPREPPWALGGPCPQPASSPLSCWSRPPAPRGLSDATPRAPRRPPCAAPSRLRAARLSAGAGRTRARQHLLPGLRLVDDADEPLGGALALLPAAGGGQQREPGVPEVPGGQHHQGGAPCDACKPAGKAWPRLALGVGAQVSSAGPGRAPPGSGAVTTHHPPLPVSWAHPSSAVHAARDPGGGLGIAARGRSWPWPQGPRGGADPGDSPRRAPFAVVPSISARGDALESRGAPGALDEGLGGRQAQLLPPLEVLHDAPALDAGHRAQHLRQQLNLHPGDRQAPRLAGGSTRRTVLQKGRAPGAAWWGRMLGTSRVSREPPGTRTNL